MIVPTLMRLIPGPVRRRLGPEREAVLARFIQFGMVGVTGLLVDTAVVYALRDAVGLYAAGLLSFFVAASWTWALNRAWTFAGRGGGPMWRQWLHFLFVNLSGLVLNRGAYFLLVTFSATCRTYPVLAVAAGAVAGMFANFSAANRLVFKDRSAG